MTSAADRVEDVPEVTADELTFAELIKTARERKGMSQRGLAKALKVTQGAVSAWETGDGRAEVGRLADIADALSIPADILIRAVALPLPTPPS